MVKWKSTVKERIMPVRKYQPYEFEEEETQTTLYQDYVPETTSVASLKAVLFFVNIACFCVFLALKFNTVLAFSLAIALSLAASNVQRSMIKKKLY